MFLDSDDIRGILRGTAIITGAVAIAFFVSAFGSEGGMKKDKASGVVYFVDKQPADSSRASLGWGAAGLSVLFLTASLFIPKSRSKPPENNARDVT